MSAALALLVPIKLAALCVRPRDRLAGMKFGKLAAEFQNLETRPYLGTSVVPEPFEDEPAPAGIHLHWALPDALTRGDPGSREGFREVPNRFLVVRLAVTGETPARFERKAWVVESDYLWRHEDGGLREDDARNALSRTVPMVHAQRLDSMVLPTYAFQGRVRPLDGAWRDEPAGRRAPFTALGYGTEAYAAAYPHCRNVFGFFDPCHDARSASDGLEMRHRHLSYLVVGWYADAALDPVHTIAPRAAEIVAELRRTSGPGPLNEAELANEALAKALAADFHWSYAARDRSHGPRGPRDGQGRGWTRRPERTLFVGQMTGVEWDPDDAQPVRHDEPICVAMGATTSEALSALLARAPGFQGNAGEVEALLNDLQFDLLPEHATAAGQASLADARHLRDFAPVPAADAGTSESGRLWIIKRAGERAPVEIDDRQALKLPPRLGRALRALNQEQAACDELAIGLATRRSQLFADWGTYLPAKDEASRAYLEHQIHGLEALAAELSQRQAARDLAKATVVGRLSESDVPPPGYELDSVAAPRFYQPNDPVILLSGVNPSTRYGGDGRLDPDRQMVCRLSDEITTWGAERKLPPAARAGLDEVTRREHWAEFLGHALPATESLISLCIEACLLDPSRATHLDFGEFARWQQAYLQGHLEPLTGYAPSAIGLAAYERPWIPLIMQWQVSYRPFLHGSPTGQAPVDYPANWAVQDFALSHDEPEIRHAGNQPGLTGSTTYEGTVTLTNNVQANLMGQIDRYLQEHPANAESERPETTQWRHTLEALRALPFRMMAQSMDGLHRQMLMRSSSLQMPVLDPPQVSIRARPELKSAVTEALFFSDRVSRAVGRERHSGRRDDRSQFHPLRAGMLKITRLRLIDAFGQIRDVIAPDPLAGEVGADRVILPARLKAPPAWNDSAALLPLRIAQPARLSFRYRSASQPRGAAASAAARETNSDAASSPVFGWILHNRFDHALALYDEEGRPLGSFNLRGLAWQEAPGPNKGVANADLMDFIHHLGGGWESGKRGSFQREFLVELIETIDRAVAGVDIEGYRQDQGLAVLIGRPLALVRAELRLDLYGTLSADKRRRAGLPVLDQGRDAFMMAVARSRIRVGDNEERNRRAAHIDTVRFPVRLGDDAKVHDGLVGYFVDGADAAATYRTFFAPTAASGRTDIVKPPLTGAGCLTLAGADEAPVGVVMLVDPRAPVHATTGILPVKRIELPPHQYAQALKRIDATFLAAPVLGGSSGTALPVPAEVGHAWSWLTRHADEELFDAKGAGVRKWATQDLVDSPNTRAGFSAAPLRLSEGWLHLYPSAPASDEAKDAAAPKAPTPFDVTLRPNAVGDLILAPETATLHGTAITVAEVDDGSRFIGYWRDEGDWVSWKVDACGGYGLDLRCSAPFDSQFNVEALDARGELVWTELCRVPATGWDQIRRPQIVRPGDVHAWVEAAPRMCFGLEPGAFEIRIKPAHRLWRDDTREAVERPWSAVNLWSLALCKRVEEDAALTRLRACDATLQGEEIRFLRRPEAPQPENACITGWTDPTDFATWRVGLRAGLRQLHLERRTMGATEDVVCTVGIEVRRAAGGSIVASSRVVSIGGRQRIHVLDLETDTAGEYEVKLGLVQGKIELLGLVLDATAVVTMADGALVLLPEHAVLLDDGGGMASRTPADAQRQQLRLTSSAHAAWTVDVGDAQVDKMDAEVMYSTARAGARLVLEASELNASEVLGRVVLACDGSGEPAALQTQAFRALQLLPARRKAGRYRLALRLEDPADGTSIEIRRITLSMPS